MLCHCWFRVRKSIQPAKKLSDKVLAWLSVCSAVQMIRIWSNWCHCHPIISCFIKIHTDLTFLVPVYPGCPGKEAIKWVCVNCRINIEVFKYWYCQPGICYNTVGIICTVQIPSVRPRSMKGASQNLFVHHNFIIIYIKCSDMVGWQEETEKPA